MADFPFTLGQLKILQTIINEGGFKKAAEKLYISQPAVSLQIKKLEQQLNTPIFYRDRRKVELTEAGELLLKYCERILNLCDETCRALDGLEALYSSNFIIGGSEITGTYLMPPLIGTFRHKYPQITIGLKINSTRRIAWGVANGQIDLAIVEGKIPAKLQSQLSILPYAEDELALILPPAHPLSDLEFLQKEDLYRLRFLILEGESTICNVISRSLTQNGIDSKRIKIEMELNSIEAIKNAVQSDFGVAFVSVFAILKELELGVLHQAKIEGVTIKRDLAVLINPRRYYENSATSTFRKEILELILASSSILENPVSPME